MSGSATAAGMVYVVFCRIRSSCSSDVALCLCLSCWQPQLRLYRPVLASFCCLLLPRQLGRHLSSALQHVHVYCCAVATQPDCLVHALWCTLLGLPHVPRTLEACFLCVSITNHTAISMCALGVGELSLLLLTVLLCWIWQCPLFTRIPGGGCLHSLPLIGHVMTCLVARRICQQFDWPPFTRYMYALFLGVCLRGQCGCTQFQTAVPP